MKKENQSGWEWLCDGLSPDDGIPTHVLENRERREYQKQTRNRMKHRTRQYASQVHEALETGLACDCGDPLLGEVTINRVEPVAGCAALLVTVGVPVATIEELDEVHGRLVAVAGLLRSAIADRTHRKKVPSLRFEVFPETSFNEGDSR